MKRITAGTMVGIIFSTSLFLFHLHAQKNNPALTREYFDRQPPEDRPEIFERQISPAIRVYSYYEFLDSGRFFFFKGSSSSREGIFIMDFKKGAWSEPELVLPAAPDLYEDRHFFLTVDKKKIFFTSRRPRNTEEENSENPNIWIMEHKSGGWTQPRLLQSPVNSDSAEFYTTLTKEGTLYFSRSPNEEDCNIFRSELKNGRYSDVEPLDSTINSEYTDGDPYIAPDESYMIFLSDRPEGLGQHDFYISFRSMAGKWTKPLHLGKRINSSGNDVCPLVTSDGKYFFFNSNRSGKWNIYWMDAGFINQLKKSELESYRSF